MTNTSELTVQKPYTSSERGVKYRDVLCDRNIPHGFPKEGGRHVRGALVRAGFPKVAAMCAVAPEEESMGRETPRVRSSSGRVCGPRSGARARCTWLP